MLTIQPFTFAGEVIISVNPYQSIHTDNEEDSVREYLEKEVFDRPPHVFGAVDLAYLDMKCNNEDTSIVFSGTYIRKPKCCLKFILHYIIR